MLSSLLTVLRDAVNEYLAAAAGWDGAQTEHGQVVFLESDKLDLIEFKLGSITLLLVNLAQEHAMRPADPHRVMLSDGTVMRASPPIHLSVDVMFVARFKEYRQSLRSLSLILKFLQAQRCFDHESAPALSPEIEKVTIELLTPPLQEQQNLWSLLKSAYQPSLIYRLRMLVVQDAGELRVPPVTSAPTAVGT